MHNNYRRFGLLSSSVVLLFLTTRCTAHSGETESTTEDNALRQALSELSRRRLAVGGTGMLSNMVLKNQPPRKTIEEYREICARAGNEGPCPTCICKRSGKQRRNCKAFTPLAWFHFGTCACRPCSICREASCCPKCWKRFDITKIRDLKHIGGKNAGEYDLLCAKLHKDLEALNVGDRIMVSDYNLYKKGADGTWLPAIYTGVDDKKNMIRVTFDAAPNKTLRAPLDINSVRLPGHQSVIQTSLNEQKRQFTKHHVCRE